MDHDDPKNQVKDILDLITNEIQKEEQKHDDKLSVPKESGTAWTQKYVKISLKCKLLTFCFLN